MPTTDPLHPAGVSERLDSLVAARAAIDRVIASAGRALAIFEPSLTDVAYHGAPRAALLEAFLTARRGNRLRIALHDAARLERDCPRIVALLRRYSHAVEVRATVGSARSAQDAMVIADRHSHWRRFNVEQPGSLWVLGDSAATAPLLGRFEEIWESAEPAASATVLGL